MRKYTIQFSEIYKPFESTTDPEVFPLNTTDEKMLGLNFLLYGR